MVQKNLSSNILLRIHAVTNIGKYIYFSNMNFTFFLTGPKVSTWRVSSLWKQPFRCPPLKIANSFTLLFNTVFVAKLFNP